MQKLKKQMQTGWLVILRLSSSRRLRVSALFVLLLLSIIIKTVEVTKTSPAPPPTALGPLQTACILLSRDVVANVVYASSTRTPFLSEHVPRPPGRRIVVFPSRGSEISPFALRLVFRSVSLPSPP